MALAGPRPDAYAVPRCMRGRQRLKAERDRRLEISRREVDELHSEPSSSVSFPWSSPVWPDRSSAHGGISPVRRTIGFPPLIQTVNASISWPSSSLPSTFNVSFTWIVGKCCSAHHHGGARSTLSFVPFVAV